MKAESASATPRRERLSSIDALRGLIMIIMAIDHVRDFVHRGAMSGSPTDLATTTPVLFMTRWITHFCAPGFMLTAGLGAWFYRQRGGRTKGELARFLITRGLWLIVLEFTVMQFAYNFNFSTANPIFMIVLYVLGACMIILAGLIWLPLPVLVPLCLAVVLLHNVSDGIRAQQFGSWAPLWLILHQIGAFPFAGRLWISAYSLVPWFAVMALGFALGSIYGWPPLERRRFLMRTGAALTIAFLIVRAINIYGDPSRWSPQQSATYTALSFLNTTKYPPSLDFLLMTLGPALIVLALFDGRAFSRSNPLIVFGRVPLFYFVLHFIAGHVAIVLLAFARYGPAAAGFMFQPLPSEGGPAKLFPPDFGFELWVAYVVWIGVVLLMYPLCRWFASVKARNSSPWLSYL